MYTSSSVWCVYDHTKPYQLHWARGTTEPLEPTVAAIGSRFQLSYLYLSYGWVHCLGKKEVLADGIAGLDRLISEQILSLSSLWLNKANTHLGVRTLFVRVALLLAVVALLKFSGIVASHPLPSLKTSLVCISSLWVKKQVMWPSPCTRGVSDLLLQKKGRVWWTAYTSCVPLHYIVWSNHVAVFCHTTHYITVWVAIAVLKTAKES